MIAVTESSCVRSEMVSGDFFPFSLDAWIQFFCSYVLNSVKNFRLQIDREFSSVCFLSWFSTNSCAYKVHKIESIKECINQTRARRWWWWWWWCGDLNFNKFDFFLFFFSFCQFRSYTISFNYIAFITMGVHEKFAWFTHRQKINGSRTDNKRLFV